MGIQPPAVLCCARVVTCLSVAQASRLVVSLRWTYADACLYVDLHMKISFVHNVTFALLIDKISVSDKTLSITLSYLQEPATGICPERDESGSHSIILYLKIHFNIILLFVPNTK